MIMGLMVMIPLKYDKKDRENDTFIQMNALRARKGPKRHYFDCLEAKETAARTPRNVGRERKKI